MIIGVTLRNVKMDEIDILKVNKSIANYILKYDAIPIFITNINHFSSIASIFDGFIIPGGNNWENIDEEVLKYAYDNDVPVLGICAGMQLIGSFNGKEVSDNTTPINNDNHKSNDTYVHDIIINDGILKDIFKKNSIKVNSRHKDKIKFSNDFIIDAISNDGIIEAIHLPNKKFIFGVQWHPEDIIDENSEKLFLYFIEQVKK